MSRVVRNDVANVANVAVEKTFLVASLEPWDQYCKTFSRPADAAPIING